MKLKSFFWQVFLALVLLCSSALLVFDRLSRMIADPYWVLYITIGVVFFISYFIASRLSRPLQVLKHHLNLMAEGELSSRVKKLDTDLIEIHQIAAAMEKVRDQLNQRIQVITLQKNEQDALLASMFEGVIAVDQEMRILHVNSSAESILGMGVETSKGQFLHEAIRVTEVLDAVELSLKQGSMVERDIELSGRKTKYLQVHVSPMRMAEESRYGAVLVFSDVSRIRELEGMRKNFVANVSHELRTPLTSIQGFAETLLNPSVKDPAEVKKFLQIIQKHASRLSRIIDDILTLSRIERDAESHQIALELKDLQPILVNVVELCTIKAQQKSIKIQLICDSAIQAYVDESLIEQAVINLIDNAIRYSNPNSTVTVEAALRPTDVIIRVTDQGVGMEQRQLGRIFERFYRVDPARSRELGGTGLGLSIVKHITLAHGGQVEVQSELGRGSVFSIILPLQVKPKA